MDNTTISTVGRWEMGDGKWMVLYVLRRCRAALCINSRQSQCITLDSLYVDSRQSQWITQQSVPLGYGRQWITQQSALLGDGR
eukprot:6637375-Ditylum_brightwellii.AAC.1